MPSSWRYASLIAVLLYLGGCKGADSSSELIVADSSGLEVVTNPHAPSSIPVRRLSDVPESEITGDVFYQISAIGRLSRNHLGVGVGGSGSVLVYDEAGTLVRTFGRTGDGPGEFRSIGGLFSMPGDSVGVYDPQLRRLTVFSPAGELGRTINLAELAPDAGWSRVHSVGDGLIFVGEAGLAPRQEEGPYRSTASSHRIDWEGNVLSSYGEFPGTEMFFGSLLFGPLPFGKALSTATLGSDFVVGTGDSPELQVFDSDGDLKRLIRWQDENRTVTQARMDDFVDFLLEEAPTEEAEARRERFGSMPFADTHPAYARLISATGGTLWVGEYSGPEVSQANRRVPSLRWMVLEVNGEISERIQTPEGFVPFLVEDSRVWGVYRDGLDVESVRAYRIDR